MYHIQKIMSINLTPFLTWTEILKKAVCEEFLNMAPCSQK